MRKRYTPFIFMFLLWSSDCLIAQTYQVRLAAFTDGIEASFFDFAGYHDVYQEKDHHDFTRYTLGEYFTFEEANNKRQAAIKAGFSNAHILTIEPPQYAYVGDAPELPLMMVPEAEKLYIRSILFRADDLSLNNALLTSLEEALIVMKKQTDLKLRIVGYTDDIGERTDNQAISKKRARIIQNFLLANGIPAYRLKMKVSEEPSPAIYFKGKGLPKTRDFNRRIVMTLVDLKEEIVLDDFSNKKKTNEDLSANTDLIELLKFVKLV